MTTTHKAAASTPEAGPLHRLDDEHYINLALVAHIEIDNSNPNGPKCTIASNGSTMILGGYAAVALVELLHPELAAEKEKAEKEAAEEKEKTKHPHASHEHAKHGHTK